MELLQLKYFCDAAQTENFSVTAKKFGVPASNISQSIHRLEQELETKLFERSANRVRLGNKGKMFYREAKQAMLCLENAQKAIRDDGKICGEINICILTNRRIVTEVIGAFKKQYPEVTFRIRHTLSENAESFDLIVGDDTLFISDFTAKKLLKEKLCLAVHKSHASEKMQSLRFITMQKNSSQYFYTLEAGKLFGFVPNVAIETDDPFYVRKYIEMGLGAAIVPAFSWQGLFSDEICFVELENFNRITNVYTNNLRYKSRAVLKFQNALSDACNAEKQRELLHFD